MNIFAKVDVSLPRHHRLIRIAARQRAEALGVWTAALCYSRENELDGFCPLGAIDEIARKQVVDQLVSVGLFARDERDGDHGVLLPGYALSNETKAEIVNRKRRQRLRLVPDRLRVLVLERDGLVCRLCGLDVAPDDVHIDHREPLSRGGPTTLENLQVAHSRCNTHKGARVQ